jgi:hypothetical protein
LRRRGSFAGSFRGGAPAPCRVRPPAPCRVRPPAPCRVRPPAPCRVRPGVPCRVSSLAGFTIRAAPTKSAASRRGWRASDLQPAP